LPALFRVRKTYRRAVSSSDAFLWTARSLLIDRVAGEVIADLRAHDIEPILLKGASIAKALYTDGTPRAYGDVDLLVDPDDIQAAEQRLGELGFELDAALDFPYKTPWVERVWRRRGDEAVVDLHRNLHSVGATDEQAWEVLSKRTSEMSVGGVTTRVLDPAAIGFHLAMHAGHHGVENPKGLEDLRRGLARFDESTWKEALGIARSLDAVDAFSGGLHLLDEGKALARGLTIDPPGRTETLIQMEGAPHFALGLDRLFRLSGVKTRVVYVLRAVFPPKAAMIRTDERASQGRLGLVGAYVRRWRWMIASAPRAVAAYVRAMRRKRRP
jgi:hypothetical protein